MLKTLERATILQNHEIRPGIWSMWLNSPKIANEAKPGQFVHIRIEDSFLPLLRRPISIGRVDGDKLEFVWRTVGTGTELMTSKSEGDQIDLLGPLGTGFRVTSNIKSAILVGGGLGAPPLVYLHGYLGEMGINSRLIIGAKDEAGIPLASNDPLLDDDSVIVTLESDSEFRKGMVTQPLAEEIELKRQEGELMTAAFYSCGPWGLVKALKKVVPESEFAIEDVSLEQQMGCAMGVCQGCAVNVKGGKTPYQLVCHDGPVFPLFDVEVPDGV